MKIVYISLSLVALPVTARAQGFLDLFSSSNKKSDAKTADENKEAQEFKLMMKDPKKRRKYVDDCISMMYEMQSRCKKTLPVLDTSSCDELVMKSRQDAKNKCERLAAGEELR